MAAFDTWDSYFYPETYDPRTGTATLRNLYEIRDAAKLHDREYTATARRGAELSAGLVSVERTYDAAHLRAIHRHLFQDVYAWAGQFRTVNITKGMTEFATLGDGALDRRLSEVRDRVASVDWQGLDRSGFVTQAAAVFADLNNAHPFREGNGRTSKVFMEHVAERSQFDLSWAAVPAAAWNQASEFSSPDLGAWQTHPEELHAVFSAMTTDRPAPIQAKRVESERPRDAGRAPEAKKSLGGTMREARARLVLQSRLWRVSAA